VRAVIQRVTEAHVAVGREIVAQIGAGLCVLLGIGKQDDAENAQALADKIKNLRVFEDHQGKMNRSITDIAGELLVVSQFTLYADCRKGTRPSFSDAAPAAEAERLYHLFIQRLRKTGLKVGTGSFQARMKVSLINDGPVTFILED
jgi:D-tyrosyl-tRNA(Tyr) deacylase